MITIMRPGQKDSIHRDRLSPDSQAALAAQAKNYRGCLVLCSDHPRAHKTARLLAPDCDIRIRQELIFDQDLESAYGKQLVQSFQEKNFLRFLLTKSTSLAGLGDFHYEAAVHTMRTLIEECSLFGRPCVIIAHTGFAEAFLAWAIRESAGEAEQERFIQAIKGFEFRSLELYQVVIEESRLIVRYRQGYEPYFAGEYALPRY